MLRIAIDGACRRNGKPDCISAGGVYVRKVNEDGDVLWHSLAGISETESTNQRGELLALDKALTYIYNFGEEAIVVTDSEYIYNAMTKRWCDKWANNGWVTASGGNVKNADIWEVIYNKACHIEKRGIEVTYYHIKGHCIPFGTVTADKLLSVDDTGEKLYREVQKKFDLVAPTKKDVFAKAQALSEVNNGFKLPKKIFKEFVVMNTVVDAIATTEVNNADAGYTSSRISIDK